jgi:hypothetical protein
MEKVNVRDQVMSLINKAENAEKSDDALKFSQAACNAANAACAASTANLIGDFIRDDDGRIIGRITTNT